MQKILITEPIVDFAINKLKDRFSVDIGEPGQFNSEDALIQVISEYDALLCMLSCAVTATVLKAGERLKIVANHAVGYNNIDIATAKQHNIRVSNTPDVLDDATADLTFALLLNVARNLDDAQYYLRAGKFEGWEPLGFLGMELNGSTLGIIGLGRIGKAVAKRAKSFGMKIHYHNSSRLCDEIEKEFDAVYEPAVDDLISKSDCISLHCPLTEETHHLINRERLQLMKSHAILINTARGPIVDEEALAEALISRRIGGAGLDVFENEPAVHPKLLNAPNCVILPHIGSATFKARNAMGELAANAIISVLSGTPDSEIPNLIV